MKKGIAPATSAALIRAPRLGLTGCVTAPAATPGTDDTAVITVSASGSVRLVPDRATVSFGVSTQAPSAEDAQSENSRSVNRVIEVLTGRGIEEKSIRTANYSMYPQVDWSDSGEQRIIGYRVTTTLTVQDQKIEEIGALLSACVEAGINQVDNISFLCSGYDEAYREALALAVAASRDKAETLAAAAGKTLGDPVSVTEGWQDASARYTRGVAAEMAKQDAVNIPSFQPGETEISATVTVTYQMK